MRHQSATTSRHVEHHLGPFAAVLFDMDGVIVDTESAVAAFWQDVAQRHGVRISDEEMTHVVHGRPARGVLDALFPWLDADGRKEVHATMREYEADGGYFAMPGALALLQSLRRLGVPTAIVTSGDAAKASVVQRALNLGDLFSAVVTADDVGAGKPDPECYLLAAEELGAAPQECVVFEDAVSGARAAIAAGATCVGIGGPAREAALLKEGAAVVIPDFAGLGVIGDVPAEAGSTQAVFHLPPGEPADSSESLGA